MKDTIEPMRMWHTTKDNVGAFICHVCGRSKSYAGRQYTNRTLKLHITKVHGRHYHKRKVVKK